MSAVTPIGETGVASSRASWPLELAALGAIWGASFLFMRVSATDFGPLPQVTVRLGLGALALAPWWWRARARFTLDRWPWLLAIGLINSALPFLLFSWAAQQAPAGVSAIANATTVLFAAAIGALCFGEAVDRRRAIAIGVGLLGVIVLAAGKVEGVQLGWPVAAALLASFCYGIGLHLVRRRLSDLPAAAVAAATLGTSALLLAPLAGWQWPATPIPARAWLATHALGLLCTGLAYVLYYRLVARVGPARTSTVTYLVPAFGVAWAWWLLDEPLTPRMGLAALLILGSVMGAQRVARREM